MTFVKFLGNFAIEWICRLLLLFLYSCSLHFVAVRWFVFLRHPPVGVFNLKGHKVLETYLKLENLTVVVAVQNYSRNDASIEFRLVFVFL